MGENYLKSQQLKDLLIKKYPFADSIINWQLYHINRCLDQISYLHTDFYEFILFCKYIDKWEFSPTQLVDLSSLKNTYSNYKEHLVDFNEAGIDFWNEKEYKPMKVDPLKLTKKDVLNFDPILVLIFNNKNTIIDGKHRWIASLKLKSKLPCIYVKRKNNYHPLNKKIKKLAIDLFKDKRLQNNG